MQTFDVVATGKKIVCGGTSQVVARYLHEGHDFDDLLL